MPSAAQTSVSAGRIMIDRRPLESGTAGGPDSSNPVRPVSDDLTQPAFRTLRAVSETAADHLAVDTFEPVVIRELNRAVTRKELLPQRRQIARQRALLFRKGLDEQLTRREEAKLRYLEWQLDRIEDADIGEELDKLSAIASVHEALAQKVKAWLKEMRKILPERSKHAGRRAARSRR